MPDEQTAVASCVFCGRSSHEVRTLITAPLAAICDSCIDICVDVLAERDVERDRRGDKVLVTPVVPCALCRQSVPREDLVAIPDREPICAACLEVLRAVIDSP